MRYLVLRDMITWAFWSHSYHLHQYHLSPLLLQQLHIFPFLSFLLLGQERHKFSGNLLSRNTDLVKSMNLIASTLYYVPDCKVLFLRGEQKISSNFLRGSGTETSVTKPVQTDT